MKRAMSAALLFLSFSACAAFATQAPKPSEPKQPDAPKQTQVQIVGTDQAPIVVKMTPQPVDESQRAEAKREREEDKAERQAEDKEKSENDNAMIGWTGVLVFVGVIQAVVFVWQGGSLHKTIKEMEKGTAATRDLATAAHAQAESTKQLAAAAQTQADAIMRSERPFVFIEAMSAVQMPSSVGMTIDIRFKVWNRGKTPAEIVGFRAYGVAEKRREDAPKRVQANVAVGGQSPQGRGIEAGGFVEHMVQAIVTYQNMTALGNRTLCVYCVGEVLYKDIFDKKWKTSFCRLCTWGDEGMAFIDDPESELNFRT